MDPLLEQFLSEARDNLSYLDAHLKDLQDGDPEEINALFRAAHTLKGGAGLVGFEAVKNITHVAEDLLDNFRNHKIEYSDALVDTLFDAFDEVFELIEIAESEGSLETLDIDDDKIKEIQTEIRQFLTNKEEANETDNEQSPYEPPFNLEETIPLTELNVKQIRQILPITPLTPPNVTVSFAAETHPWVLDLDLDTDTLVLGNDPVYLMDMMADNLIAIQTEVHQCDKLEQDPLQWFTQFKPIIQAPATEIEEVFYNLIYDASPLHIGCLITPKEPLTETQIETLLPEPVYDKETLTAKLNDTQSPEEQWLMQRLIDLIDASATPEQLQAAYQWIGVSTDTTASEASSTTDQTPTTTEQAFDDTTHQALIDILHAQQSSLDYDPAALVHVPKTLCRVAHFMQHECSLPTDIADSKQLIQTLLALLEETVEAGEPAQQETPPEKSNPSEPTSKSQAEPPTASPSPSPSPSSDTPSSQTKPAHKSAKNGELAASTPGNAVPKTIKIDQQEIDELMDIVGELLVVKNALPFIAEEIQEDQARRDLTTKYEQLNRMVMQLQDKVMGMRLLPLSYILNRYPKLVRDLSKKLHKKINYIEEGGETKLDKMMIEQLADPMIHIIRNSLDHGLEPPEERLAAGKPETGTLKVSARSEGDRVYIEVSDDGRGIDVDKIINKVLEKRLINPDDIDKMTEADKLALIFLPGLSTKEEVSDLSGRGVGADAVKTTVESLGGKVLVKSKKGQGTTITLELPVSVALSSVFQIKMGGQNYAIDMEQIVETENVNKNDIQTAHHQPIIHLRDEVIPIIQYEPLLNRDTLKESESMLILHSQIGKVAFIVDEFIGQLDIVQKPLTGPLANHPLISGVALLGDGSPLFVLNITALFEKTLN